MKKLLFLFAVLLTSVGAWAQTSYTVSATTGTGVSDAGYTKTWTYTVSDANPAALTLTAAAINMKVIDGQLTLWTGTAAPYTYTLQVPVFYRIVSYSFDFVRQGTYAANESVTLTVGEQTYTATTETQTVTVNNVNAGSTSFKMTGSNKGIVVTNFVVVVDCAFEVTTDESKPIWHTIKNVRGNVYAQYNGSGQKMQLSPVADTKGHLFYFTAGSNGGYKIHNAATTNMCADFTSWTADGIEWYIEKSGNADKPGFAISKKSDLTQQVAWNNEAGKNLKISNWDGNDIGSTWAIELFTDDISSLGIKMSTNDTKYLYNIKNDRKSKFANYTGSGKFSQTGGTNPGSYWYFVEVPGVEGVPEGYKACYIYNAATDLAVQNHSNGYMSTPTDGTYPAKIYFVGPYEATYWGYVIYPKNSDKGWNDLDGSSVTDYNYKTDGSIWDIIPADKTEATLKTEAATAKTNALNKIALYEYADYYTYADDAIATAKTTVNAATNDNLKNALFGHVAINNAIATLEASAKGTTAPAAGDIIQLKHKVDNKYLKANDTDASNTNNQNDLATYWLVEEGNNGNVKLKNVSTNKYIGTIRKSATVAMQADVANAAQFAWTNQTGTYAVFKDVNIEGVEEGDLNHLYGHVNNGKLVGWEPNADNTQWLVSKVNSFTIVYKHNDVVQSTVTEYVKQGAVYTVSSPIAFTAPSAVTVGEAELEAADGVFSFEPTGGETVTVELVESLPFTKTKLNDDGSFPLNAVWYVILQNSTANSAQAWKYDAENGVTTEAISGITAYTDNHLWCFAGSKDDLKIYNKVAGSSLSLTNTDPASMVAVNEAVWKMAKSADEATFSGKGPFCLQKGDETSYLNLGDRQLKYYSERDKGSTIRVAAYLSVKYMFKGVELTEHSVNQLVELGSTHTITNPYANKYVNVTCAVNGNRVKTVDGQWTVNISQATSVIVTITEDLPFKTSTDYATANWQYLQANSSSWKFVQKNENDNNTSSANVNSLGDRALWAFVGDAINGFKILNKGAEGAVLTVDDTNNATVAYMKKSGDQIWTIEKGNGGFVIRQGAQECLNDFGGGGVIKIYNHQNSPTGTGSAFRTISGGVTDLADLCFPGIFTLQAERSPLLYDANAGEPTKLSSGMVSNIPANAKDSRQQFMISKSDTDGLYYLYNIAAARFVDANLNFTDYPEPVLSFEANPANPVFPWFVKIGGKYVVPGSGGTEGNKIHHIESADNDDGKRYRIEKADEDMDLAYSLAYVIGYAEALLKDASSLDNSKVYLVSTCDRGAWMYNDDEKDALWSTRVADPNSADPNNPNWLPGSANSEDKAQQFAFLTVGGKTYLYSVGAGKFVVKSGDYTAYSDNPTQPVVLLPAAGNKFFPIVVAFVDGENQHHIGISNGITPPVITNYNNLEDSGNKVDIRGVGDLENSVEILAEMETYLIAQTLVPELQALIEKADLALKYLLEADKTALDAAKSAAEDVLASGSYTAEMLGNQITALTTALNNATLVSETTGFNNAYVYTFVSKRGWMVATEEDATVKSTDEGAANNPLHQWAVYKSVNNKYYLYNIGKQQFMGFANVQNDEIPFAATPQMTTLTFKKSNWEDYPIMFSVDNVGVVNNNERGAMIYWNNGWTNLEDGGNNHKVTIVGAVPSETRTAIESKVVFFEATHALDVAIAAVQAKVDVMDKLGYYSSSNENFEAEFNVIKDFKAAITAETTVDAINAQTTAANNLVATFTVLNKPQAGKFYRFKHPSKDAYMLSNKHTDNKRLAMGPLGNNPISSIFYYDREENSLLSYAIGQYLSEADDAINSEDWTCKTVGSEAPEVTFDAGYALGTIGFYLGNNESRAYYSARETYVDAGGEMANANGGYDWTVEEVTTLPFTFKEAALGYATFNAPVAVELPYGVNAYIGEIVEGNKLLMRKFDEGKIPANTAVLLYNSDYAKTQEVSLSIIESTGYTQDELEDIDAKDDFVGTVAAENPNAEKDCYSLQKSTATEGDSAGKMGFFKKTSGTKGGFKAWLEIAKSASNARAFTIIFDGDDATGLKETLGLENENVEIYDLSGRRLDKPAKGVNVVGGKLVIK